jgi:hypothetical protein
VRGAANDEGPRHRGGNRTAARPFFLPRDDIQQIGDPMTNKPKAYREPSDVKAVDGSVEVQGPDDVDVVLTPEAAEETSDRLLLHSLQARGQRRLKDIAHQPKK